MTKLFRAIAFCLLLTSLLIRANVKLQADSCTYYEGWFELCGTCNVTPNYPWRSVYVTSCALVIGNCSSFYTECNSYCQSFGSTVYNFCTGGGEDEQITYGECVCSVW